MFREGQITKITSFSSLPPPFFAIYYSEEKKKKAVMYILYK